MFTAAGSLAGNEAFWIGLNNNNAPATYIWSSTGKGLTFGVTPNVAPWDPNSPTRVPNSCTLLGIDPTGLINWADGPCNTPGARYLCELSAECNLLV